MQYSDGNEVLLGDIVKLGQDHNGVVVCIIDTDEYSDEYTKEDWGYLQEGALINYPLYGLVHYKVIEPAVELLSRKN